MTDRRTTLAVAAAVVVALVVIGLVLAFGIRPLPAFRAASAAPTLEAPGRITYLSADADEPCVRVVPARGGSPQTLSCAGSDAGLRWIDTVAWTPEGEVLVGASTDVGDSVVLVVDPSNGEVIDRIVRPPGELLPGSWQGPRAGRVREDGAELLIGGDEGSPRVAVRSSQGGTRTSSASTVPATTASPTPSGRRTASGSPSSTARSVCSSSTRRGTRNLACSPRTSSPEAGRWRGSSPARTAGPSTRRTWPPTRRHGSGLCPDLTLAGSGTTWAIGTLAERRADSALHPGSPVSLRPKGKDRCSSR